MKVTRLTLWSVDLTSHQTYYMAEGKTCATVETHVLCLETDTGLKGWGEVCPIPHYLPAYARGVGPALQDLAATLLGADPVGPEALMARLDAQLKGHDYAKSAIDLALWDLTGKAAGLPLYALLGGRRVERLPLYHSITCVDPHEMARMAREAGGRVTILSSDKDLMQLVGGGVEMLDPMKNKRLGVEEVEAKFGVGPERVVDVQALAGDSVDNVPGAPGIGVKTAAQLIGDYGDLETLLARAEEIKQPKRRQTLIDHADQIRLSKQLVQLDGQVPLSFGLDDL
ncbi:MAG: 5'-3' exonuclease H3TH domain-containing protein, partial [Pseudomonadota bacterium]